MRCSHSGRTTKYSAAAPLIEKPKWSVPMTHSPTTRSPTDHPLTLLPISATSPAHS